MFMAISSVLDLRRRVGGIAGRRPGPSAASGGVALEEGLGILVRSLVIFCGRATLAGGERPGGPMIYRFDRCELDIERHRFSVDGAERPLEPQVFDLLHLLARQPGRLVTRDALVDAVWGGRIVSEATISSRINAARRALDDDGRRQRVLRTVPRRGIQLVCPVAVDGADGALAPPRSPAPAAPEQRVRVARSADGTLIAYETTGAGPPLVRIDNPVFQPLVDAFAAGFAVTRYDLRGCGLSARAVDRVDFEAAVEDFAAVADAAGLDRFAIFAASQGVPVALAFAARQPERVRRIVLYGGFATGRALRDAAEADAFMTLLRQGLGRSDGAFVAAFATLFMPGATRQQIADFVATQRGYAEFDQIIRLRRAFDGIDLRALLPRVAAPALVLHARSDAVQPLDQARILAAGLPGAQLVVLDSDNHVPLPQDPAWDQIVRAAGDFLAADAGETEERR
jgi:pimeloyl-ACP methyl ester carboxylesterase/DNA-binding winged helix-turn-helix (wHTH) protein